MRTVRVDGALDVIRSELLPAFPAQRLPDGAHTGHVCKRARRRDRVVVCGVIASGDAAANDVEQLLAGEPKFTKSGVDTLRFATENGLHRIDPC